MSHFQILHHFTRLIITGDIKIFVQNKIFSRPTNPTFCAVYNRNQTIILSRPNVHDTFKLNLGISMYKHHSNQLPPIFSTYFTKHVQTHNYPTRNAHNYSINKTKKVFSDCAIRNCGPSFWNSLDKTVKQCKTTKHFRNQLKSVLLFEYN